LRGAFSHELENGVDLLSRHVELVDHLVDGEILEILDDGGAASAIEHPATTDSVGDALHGGCARTVPARNP
jgi:hypothetical protein